MGAATGALRRALDLLIGAFCCGLLAGMVAILAWQVFSRYVLGDPSTFSEELLRYGVIWLSLLGAALATGRGAHMAIDLLPALVPARARVWFAALGPLSLMIFGAMVLGWGGWHGVQIASGQTSAVLRLPMGAVYAALPVSGALIVLYSALNLLDLARRRAARETDPIEHALSVGD
ncbi:TRAP transporter small permease [Thioclava kandeliae]|uniref:TRAP transporter small permease protein n=1 Tax=Thioclava kandeliae TaxID=3070818 RepID=A0ABV1SJY8_9RHOB